jgi:hypothetical protein
MLPDQELIPDEKAKSLLRGWENVHS